MKNRKNFIKKFLMSIVLSYIPTVCGMDYLSIAYSLMHSQEVTDTVEQEKDTVIFQQNPDFCDISRQDTIQELLPSIPSELIQLIHDYDGISVAFTFYEPKAYSHEELDSFWDINFWSNAGKLLKIKHIYDFIERRASCAAINCSDKTVIGMCSDGAAQDTGYLVVDKSLGEFAQHKIGNLLVGYFLLHASKGYPYKMLRLHDISSTNENSLDASYFKGLGFTKSNILSGYVSCEYAPHQDPMVYVPYVYTFHKDPKALKKLEKLPLLQRAIPFKAMLERWPKFAQKKVM